MAPFTCRLSVLAILVGFICLPLRATSAQQSAPVTDCSHAKTAVDRALYTTPELRAADARMAHAYFALKAGLARAQQSVLLADQRRWIWERDGRCADKSARDLIACLRAQTDQRRRFFAGEGPNLAVDAPLQRPAFFGESRGRARGDDGPDPGRRVLRLFRPADRRKDRGRDLLLDGGDCLASRSGRTCVTEGTCPVRC
jgi:uncharacterized protein YecT (DUF1311 family)